MSSGLNYRSSQEQTQLRKFGQPQRIIDDPTLRRLARPVAGGNERRKNRSLILWQAVQECVARLEKLSEEQQEREISNRHRKRLEKQAAGLVKEQAKP